MKYTIFCLIVKLDYVKWCKIMKDQICSMPHKLATDRSISLNLYPLPHNILSGYLFQFLVKLLGFIK